jgi:hypothetical protein
MGKRERGVGSCLGVPHSLTEMYSWDRVTSMKSEITEICGLEQGHSNGVLQCVCTRLAPCHSSGL